MRHLIPLLVGLAVGAVIILVERNNVGLCIGVLAFWTTTAAINKLLRSPA